MWAYFNDGELLGHRQTGPAKVLRRVRREPANPTVARRSLPRSLAVTPYFVVGDCGSREPWRSLTESLSNTIALLDLHGAVVDRGEHLGRVARNHDVDDGWTIALLHTLLKGRS